MPPPTAAWMPHNAERWRDTCRTGAKDMPGGEWPRGPPPEGTTAGKGRKRQALRLNGTGNATTVTWSPRPWDAAQPVATAHPLWASPLAWPLLRPSKWHDTAPHPVDRGLLATPQFLYGGWSVAARSEWPSNRRGRGDARGGLGKPPRPWRALGAFPGVRRGHGRPRRTAAAGGSPPPPAARRNERHGADARSQREQR